jgi:hypothetical protein
LPSRWAIANAVTTHTLLSPEQAKALQTMKEGKKRAKPAISLNAILLAGEIAGTGRRLPAETVRGNVNRTVTANENIV